MVEKKDSLTDSLSTQPKGEGIFFLSEVFKKGEGVNNGVQKQKGSHKIV